MVASWCRNVAGPGLARDSMSPIAQGWRPPPPGSMMRAMVRAMVRATYGDAGVLRLAQVKTPEIAGNEVLCGCTRRA